MVLLAGLDILDKQLSVLKKEYNVDLMADRIIQLFNHNLIHFLILMIN